MKKNLYGLPLLLSLSLSLESISNPDNIHFDFEDQTPVFQELLFGNKTAPTTSAKPAAAETPPVVMPKPQVVTPVTPVVEVVEASAKSTIASAQSISEENERKLKELHNAAQQAYKNAHNADALAACSAWLTIPCVFASVGLFVMERQTESVLALGAFLGCIVSAAYFEKNMSSYGEEANNLLNQYDALKNEINSENNEQ